MNLQQKGVLIRLADWVVQFATLGEYDLDGPAAQKSSGLDGVYVEE